MARQGYSADFRRKVLHRLADGHSVASVAHDLDLSDQTIYELAPTRPDRPRPRVGPHDETETPS